MSVSNILKKISKIDALQMHYLQVEPLIRDDNEICSMFSEEYKDLVTSSSPSTIRALRFLTDLHEHLLFSKGFDVVFYNVPQIAKLKYDNDEENVTPQHIYDTIKEIDESTSLVVSFAPGVYATSCKNSNQIVNLLDGKLIGENTLKVKQLKDEGKFVYSSVKETEEDLCTTAIVISFFISLASLFAFQYVLSCF